MKVKKYAAIDVGSNAIRLLIMNIIKRKNEEPLFTKSAMVRAPIRLGSDSFVLGEISPKKKKRMIDSIKAFQLLMKVHNVDRYLAYATSALREANNGLQVTAEIRKKTGVKSKLSMVIVRQKSLLQRICIRLSSQIKTICLSMWVAEAPTDGL